ncbi:MAG: TonB-dependent receptor [Pseudomonadota bacterium]
MRTRSTSLNTPANAASQLDGPSLMGLCNRPCGWLLAAALSLSSITAAAQISGDERVLPLEPMRVTSSRGLADIVAGSHALITINRETLDDQLATGVVDFFRGQIGVFVQQTTPGQGLPIVRGLKGSEVLHLVDGFRVNNALFRNAPNQYLALIDANAVSSVDLLRGPPGTLYGSDAMGGVVQFVPIDPDQAAPAYLKLRGRSNDPEAMGHLALASQGDAVAARIGLTLQTVGDRTPAAGQTLPSAYRYEAADASVRWSLTPRQSLRVLIQYANQPRTSRVDRLVPGFGEDEPQSDQADFAPNRRAFGLVRYAFDQPLTWLDNISVQLGRQVIRDDRESRPFQSDMQTLESNRSTLDGVRIFATSSRSDHVLHVGLDAYRDRVDSSRSRGIQGSLMPIQSRFPDGARQSSYDAFIAHQWQWSRSLQWHWGLRYSRVELNVPARALDPSIKIEDSALTGDIGLNWQFSQSASILLKASRGFRAPNVFDVANLGDRPGNRFSIPNPNLQPETVDNLELGLRWRSDEWLAEGFIFDASFNDRITSVLTGAVDDQGRMIVQTQNAARATFQGIESRLQWQPDTDWRLELTANWVRADEQLPDQQRQPVDRIPPLNGQFQVAWQAQANWRLGTRVLAAASQDRLNPRDVQDPRIDPNGTPGWVDFGLFAHFQPSLQWDLRLRLDNLMDRAYREHGSGLDRPGRSIALELIWIRS